VPGVYACVRARVRAHITGPINSLSCKIRQVVSDIRIHACTPRGMYPSPCHRQPSAAVRFPQPSRRARATVFDPLRGRAQQKHIRDETRAGKFDFIVCYVFRFARRGCSGSVVRTTTSAAGRKGARLEIFVNGVMKSLYGDGFRSSVGRTERWLIAPTIRREPNDDYNITNLCGNDIVSTVRNVIDGNRSPTDTKR